MFLLYKSYTLLNTVTAHYKNDTHMVLQANLKNTAGNIWNMIQHSKCKNI